MQHAGQVMRAFRQLIGKENAPPNATVDEYMRWMNVVLRAAGMLPPCQRPTYRSIEATYRSIEVRTDHGIEERKTRYIGDPAEGLAQIVVGAIHCTARCHGATKPAGGIK
jgi:hypothetical protein